MAKPLQIEIQNDFFDLGLLKNWNQEQFIKKENIDSKKPLKPKPFLKWAGGKRQLVNQFHDLKLLSPPNFDQKKSNYIEPFIGGGAVFFEALPTNAIIADLNEDLIKTYNTIKNNAEELIKNLKLYKNEKDFYLNIRNLNSKELSDLEVASRFIYLNKTCFNGMYRVNKSGKFNVPFGRYSNPLICDESNLRAVSQILKNVTIENNDYKLTLEKAKKGDFIYLDPPYYPISKTSSFVSYTNKDFHANEQIDLCKKIIELDEKGCFVMLSNSDCDFIRNLYSDLKNFKLYQVFATRAINSDASKRGKISEIVIANY
jgi:DNA adenine methylase